MLKTDYYIDREIEWAMRDANKSYIAHYLSTHKKKGKKHGNQNPSK